MSPHLAYLAGFFDGDGCVRIQARHRHQGFQLTVGAYCRVADQCQLFAEQFGGETKVHHRYRIRSGEERVIWCWERAHGKAEEVLRVLYPYLRLRRAHAELAFAFRTLVRPAGLAIRPEIQMAMRECAARLAAVIHEIPRHIGWWDVEPECDRAYLAGLFDAEGWVGTLPARRRRIRPYLGVVVNNTVDAGCLGFAQRFGGTVGLRHPKTGHPIFNWQRIGQSAEIVVSDLRPYLRLKEVA